MLARRSNARLYNGFWLFASIIPFLWPCSFSLALYRTPDKGCVPCFYDDTIFYFHLSENNIFVCGLDQENPNTIHFYFLWWNLDRQTWLALAHLAVSAPASCLGWFPRHARCPRQDPFVSTCHVSRVWLSRVTCPTAPCLTVRLFVCVRRRSAGHHPLGCSPHWYQVCSEFSVNCCVFKCSSSHSW